MEPFLQRFRRVTYSTNYLPEIDGLRFIAIFLVVVHMHVIHYMDEKFFNDGLITHPYLKALIFEGNFGVYLFFIISDFILELPFAKSYLLH
ncbi:MAG: hypothetical protein C4330_00350 [Chitinophagaceae bacterium]